jgi:hypothetical protein
VSVVFAVGGSGGGGGLLPAGSSGRARAVAVSGSGGGKLSAAGSAWAVSIAGSGSGGGATSAVSVGGVWATSGAGGGVSSAGEGSREAVSVDAIGVASTGSEPGDSELAGSAIGAETVGAPAGCVHSGSGGGIVAGVSNGVVTGSTSAPALEGAVTGRGARATSIASVLGVVTIRISGRGGLKVIRLRGSVGGVRDGAGAGPGVDPGIGSCSRETGGLLPGIARPERRPAASEDGPKPSSSITLRSTITLERGSAAICARTAPELNPVKTTAAISVRARSMRNEHRNKGIGAQLASKRGNFMVARITKQRPQYNKFALQRALAPILHSFTFRLPSQF